MEVEEFMFVHFDVQSVDEVDGFFRLTWRGVSKSNFKEFFTAVLDGTAEENLLRVQKCMAAKEEFENSKWEEKLD
jgi:hypothetical protein